MPEINMEVKTMTEVQAKIERAINGAAPGRREEVRRLFKRAEKVGLSEMALQLYQSGMSAERITDALLYKAGGGRVAPSHLSQVDDEMFVRGLTNPVMTDLDSTSAAPAPLERINDDDFARGLTNPESVNLR